MIFAQAGLVKNERGAGFDGAVMGSNVAAEMTAVLKSLRWVHKHHALLKSSGWYNIIVLQGP